MLLTVIGVWGWQQANAMVVGVDLGTGNPPPTLGGYAMTSYDPGSLAGINYISHLTGGEDDGTGQDLWASWGQHYTGNVFVNLSPNSITINLAGNVKAFSFYGEPNMFDKNYYMTATDKSGVSVTTLINGDHGSAGIGFYETDADKYLSSITIGTTDPTGFALGEFGIATDAPDGGTTGVLMGLGLGGLFMLSRCHGRSVTA